MIGREFITAGRAVFTLALPATFVEAMAAKGQAPKSWYTFRVVRKDATERWPEAWFVNLLAGPDNTQDYQPIGKLNPQTGEVALTRASRFSEEAWPVRLLRRVLAAVWQGRADQIVAAGFQLKHEGRCGRCGRTLTVPSSIDAGIGPECASRL